MTTTPILPLPEQVRQALATFQDAHNLAEVAAARALDFKRLVGSNDAERKERKAATPADEYNDYCIQLVQADKDSKAAAAHLERVEKNLNVLRELLNHASAATNLNAAEIAARTADAYATLQMVPPARAVAIHTNGLKRATVADDDSDGSELPF